jgi:hypothetical protein
VNWINVARNRSQLQALMNMVINPGVSWKAGVVLSSRATVCFLKVVFAPWSEFL